MAESHTYKVVLAPQDIPPEDADETRTFEFDSTADDQDQLHTEAVRHVVDEDIIDAGVFRQYWEVANITQADLTPVERLREAIQACQFPAAGTYQAEVSPLTIHTHTVDRPGWKHGTLTIPKSQCQKYQSWANSLTTKHAIVRNAKVREFHEAMVSAVADVQPDLHAEFENHPYQAGQTFINLAISNEQLILDELQHRFGP